MFVVQPIRVSIEETEHPIKSREILKFRHAINERTLIGKNPAGISKREDKQKIKVSTVDTEN